MKNCKHSLDLMIYCTFDLCCIEGQIRKASTKWEIMQIPIIFLPFLFQLMSRWHKNNRNCNSLVIITIRQLNYFILTSFCFQMKKTLHPLITSPPVSNNSCQTFATKSKGNCILNVVYIGTSNTYTCIQQLRQTSKKWWDICTQIWQYWIRFVHLSQSLPPRSMLP